MHSKVFGKDFFISPPVQNIHGYKATLPVMASGCKIDSKATFTRQQREVSQVSVIILVIINF